MARRVLDTLSQDIRYAMRTLRRAPGFTLVAVLSLALGVGANTAIFSLVNSLMLRSLPVEDADQLVELMQKYPGEPRGNGFWSWRSYEHFRDNNKVFSGLLAFTGGHFSVGGQKLPPETIEGEYVGGNFFPLLGLRPSIGRLLGPEDDVVGAGGSTVLSWPYWTNRFNQDPSIVGKRVFVNGLPVTVVGVAPQEFVGLASWSKPALWLPLAEEPLLDHLKQVTTNGLRLALVGRVKRGVSLAQVRAEMTVLYRFTIDERAATSKDPLVQQLRIEVAPAGAGLALLRDQFAKPLLLLMAIVGGLLLLACTNIASLLLARAATRRTEMAVRVSLGAGRLRLLRQALTESLILSLAGGLLGVWLAFLGAGALVRVIASGRQVPGLPPHLYIPVYLDRHVLLFTIGLTVLTALVFGSVPAWTAFRSAPVSMLRQMGRANETKFRRLFDKSLVAGQVALSALLLSGAALFVGHLAKLENADLGFKRDHVLLITVNPTVGGYKADQLSGPYQELLARFKNIPGVRSATLSGATPISGAGASRFATVEGFPERKEQRRYLTLNWVAPNYFHTLSTPLVEGREFSFEDKGHQLVAIVNQAMAQHYFANVSPLGKHISFDGGSDTYEIVGVVGNAKYYDISEAPLRTIYLDAFQMSLMPSNFLLRTAIMPSSLVPQVRDVVHDVLRGGSISRVTTLVQQVDASIVKERLIAWLSGLFAALGSVLAAIGLYGLLAYTVARRINEIGIRLALGATRSDVTGMVLKDALAMTVGGLVIGVPAALLGRRLAASLIEGLSLHSSAPTFLACAIMIAIALVAAYVPARRAAAVDPMEALRHE